MGAPHVAAKWTIEGRVLRVTSSTDRDSIIEAIRVVCEDPEFRPGLDLLIDARELEQAPRQLTTPLVRGRAFEIAGLGFRRCAVVAAGDPLQVSLAHVFASYADEAGIDARVFTKIEEAQYWLTIAGLAGSVILTSSAEADPTRTRSRSRATESERLARIRELLRTLLEPMSLGQGPLEGVSSTWTPAQKEAYLELKREAEEAGGPLDPRGSAE